MVDIFVYFIIISILILLGFMFYSFLSKTSNKGKTMIRWKFVLCKILQIEFESEHDNNSKNESTLHTQ